jgi:hypothetical protein
MEFGVGFLAGGVIMGWAITHLAAIRERVTILEKAGARKCQQLERTLLREK